MKLNFCLPLILISMMLTSAEESSGQHEPKDSVTIISLIQEKKARTPLEQKIDSRLLQLVNKPQTKTGSNDVQQVNVDPAGNLEVDITADVTDDLLARIKKLGGRIIFPSKQYRTLRAAINLSSVKTIAGYSEVKFIQPAAIAQTNSSSNVNPGNPVPTDKIDPKPHTTTGRKQEP